MRHRRRGRVLGRSPSPPQGHAQEPGQRAVPHRARRRGRRQRRPRSRAASSPRSPRPRKFARSSRSASRSPARRSATSKRPRSTPPTPPATATPGRTGARATSGRSGPRPSPRPSPPAAALQQLLGDKQAVTVLFADGRPPLSRPPRRLHAHRQAGQAPPGRCRPAGHPGIRRRSRPRGRSAAEKPAFSDEAAETAKA